MKSSIKTTLIAATLLAVGLSTTATAGQDSRFDPRTRLHLKHNSVLSESKAIAAQPAVGMSCPECKMVARVVKRDTGLRSKANYRAWTETRLEHACGGCGNELTRVASAKQIKWVHYCAYNADRSASCCFGS